MFPVREVFSGQFFVIIEVIEVNLGKINSEDPSLANHISISSTEKFTMSRNI